MRDPVRDQGHVRIRPAGARRLAATPDAAGVDPCPPVRPADPVALPGMSVAVEIAHDLRSPLTSILFLSERLWSGASGDVNDLQRRQLGLIYAAAFGVVNMATTLIELAKADGELLDAEPSPFSLIGVLECICDLARPLAIEKGLSLDVETPQPDRRIGQPVALSRILLNLLNNALQNTDHGGVKITATAFNAEVLEFAVTDTGRGMELPVRPRDNGHAEHATRRLLGGSGLGLKICRRLLSAMDSQLEYETESGVGTRFHFRLSLPPAIT